MPKRAKRPTTPQAQTPAPLTDPRQRLLADLAVLRVAVTAEALDEVLAQAAQQGWSPLEFATHLLGTAADRRRERSLERRLAEARLVDAPTLESFDWQFNAQTIKRAVIEELASCGFVRRQENVIVVGQSGLGKSHIFKGIGRCACVHGFRVRYTTSAELINDLKKTLADDTLTTRLRYWTNFDLLIIDEFGFDRLERQSCLEAAQLLYKVIEGRHTKRSTILVTNVDFEAWGDYLGDAPLAMAFLDRLVDGANVLKLRGRSYRAARARNLPCDKQDDKRNTE
jgi:DNA replication protein DnaC